MTPEQITKLLDAAGHGAHAAAVTALMQPTIRIVATALARSPDTHPEDAGGADLVDAFDAAVAALPLGASRFGGVPDLPPGVGWPERDGVPMELVAQLRLADVADLDPARRLPPRGSLLFFYNAQWTTFDQDQDHRSCAVIFHDGPDEALVRATPPRVQFQSEFSDTPQDAPRIHGVASLRFEATATVPGGVSPFIAAPLSDFWQDFHAYHLGGEAGKEHRLLGYVDAQDYVDAHAHGTEDQLLLQVDSDDAADFQWGDCDRLYFLMTKAELAARDFSKVRIYSILG